MRLKKTAVFFTGLLLAVMFHPGCQSSYVKGDVTTTSDLLSDNLTELEERLDDEKIDTASLEHNFIIFRLNREKIIDLDYGISDTNLFTALSNEFALDVDDRDVSIESAIELYETLMGSYPDDESFFHQRIGVCYFKIADFEYAGKYLNLALMEDIENSELFYYKAMIAAYHEGDNETAIHYLKKVDAVEAFLIEQDLLYFQASLEEDSGNAKKAMKLYEEAIDENPGRFYINFDPVTFFLENDETETAVSYVTASYDYLTSLSNDDYTMKAYRQLVELNEKLKHPTFRYDFDFSLSYETYPDLYYFSGHTYFIKRKLSIGVTLPVQEVKETKWDAVHYTTYEQYADFEGGSGVFLTVGQPLLTNMNYEITEELYTPLTKLYFTTNYIILLHPTNHYEFTIDDDGTVSSNQTNAIHLLPLDFTYYYDTERVDVDNDDYWDFIVMGYNETNDMEMVIYYPNLREYETFSFNLNKHDGELVIQDVDSDGINEILLFDNELIILKDD